MKELSSTDQDVLHLMSEGFADHEICVRLRISMHALTRALKRIETRAAVETDDAGRHYERALKMRAQRLNTSLAARLHALMDAIPQAVLIIDGRTGAIREFNQLACALFGYSREELRSLTVEDLVPETLRDVHVAYRLAFLGSLRKREMGYHPPIFGVRQDGSEIEMAIALTATTADDDVMVVCTERTGWIAGRSPKAALQPKGH
ncbi:MAG: PAS domain S-box protein [Fimbriimonas sp.]|nr:PAS domain S-box protein [Fimbriimonas sp.]